MRECTGEPVDIPLMQPFHDTSSLYQDLIGWINDCWQLWDKSLSDHDLHTFRRDQLIKMASACNAQFIDVELVEALSYSLQHFLYLWFETWAEAIPGSCDTEARCFRNFREITKTTFRLRKVNMFCETLSLLQGAFTNNNNNNNKFLISVPIWVHAITWTQIKLK